jgi:transposase
MKTIKKIDKKDIICIDESGINGDIYAKYGWSRKNKRLICDIPIKELPIKHSLIMAIDINGVIYYELYKQTAINSQLFGSFLEVLVSEYKNKYILMDNVSFHKCKIITDIIKDSGNKILFIPPYSPDFNPIEEVFSQMKSFIRKYINPVTINKNIFKLISDFSTSVNNLYNYYKHAFD